MAASSAIDQALQSYQSLDPAGWVGLYRLLPIYAGLAFCLLGSVLLAWGATPRAVWLLTTPLGALVGRVGIPPFLHLLQLKPPQGTFEWAPSALLALIGLISPPGLFFLAVGIPMGLVAAELVGRPDSLLALTAGFLISGGAAMLLWRRLAALLSSALGAWLLALGLLCALSTALPFLGIVAQKMPGAVLGAAGVLAVIGAAYQLSRPSDEERGRLRRESDGTRQRLAEKRALERKWTQGSGRG